MDEATRDAVGAMLRRTTGRALAWVVLGSGEKRRLLEELGTSEHNINELGALETEEEDDPEDGHDYSKD